MICSSDPFHITASSPTPTWLIIRGTQGGSHLNQYLPTLGTTHRARLGTKVLCQHLFRPTHIAFEQWMTDIYADVLYSYSKSFVCCILSWKGIQPLVSNHLTITERHLLAETTWAWNGLSGTSSFIPVTEEKEMSVAHKHCWMLSIESVHTLYQASKIYIYC